MRDGERRVRRAWSTTLVLVAFGALALLFAGMGALTLGRIRHAQQEARSLVDDALQSIQFASELGRDCDRERLLLDEHIFEKSQSRMRRLESEMAAVEASFQATAIGYRPLTRFPGEAEAWAKLRGDVTAIRPAVLRVLALSRDNRDVEAYEARERLNEPFRTIDAGVQTLIRINRDGADRTLEKVTSLQRASAWSVGTMGAVGLVLTLFVGSILGGVVGGRERRMRGYSARLETRNRELDCFAGRVAHDLRGPLTTVSFAASRLKKHAAGEDGSIAIMDRGLRHMEELIDDLLTLSRLGAAPSERTGDPAMAAEEVRRDMAARLCAGEAELSVHVDSATVRCPPGLLRQALSNLADNAVKYRRQDVRLELDIQGHAAADRYELSVRDNGIGMSTEQTRRAFDPFYRAVQVRDRPGTGLGLSIVKRIAESTGGTVRVDSQLGHGSRFVVTLPLGGNDVTPPRTRRPC